MVCVINSDYTIFQTNNFSFQDNEKVKLAMFDMDFTVIKTKSGKKFPVSVNDWEFLENVPEKLRKLV